MAGPAPSSPVPNDEHSGVRAYARAALGSVAVTQHVMHGSEHRDAFGLRYRNADGTYQDMDEIIVAKLARIKTFLLDVLLFKADSSEYSLEEIVPIIVLDLNDVVKDMHSGGPFCYGVGYFEMKHAKEAMANAATELFQQ